ncbi:MAG TPA: OsmC family protein [Anaerolineaceae bacterium]|nr:OsmC family protein [Anaerolineaceae bacterium]
MKGKATWQKKMSFVGASGTGFSLPMDTSVEQGGDNSGFKPTELLLVGLAGCTAMDVISILEKKRQKVTRFEVSVTGERATEHPRVFTEIHIEYDITGVDIDPAAVARAVELSETKYCAVSAMLAKSAKIEYSIKITQEENVTN